MSRGGSLHDGDLLMTALHLQVIASNNEIKYAQKSKLCRPAPVFALPMRLYQW